MLGASLTSRVAARYIEGQVVLEGVLSLLGPSLDAVQREGERHLTDLLGPVEADRYIGYRKARDRDHAHMTILSPPETKQVLERLTDEERVKDPSLSRGKAREKAKDVLLTETRKVNLSGWHARGLGRAEAGSDITYFIVVDWPDGQKLRKSMGFEPKDFHITVGFDSRDVHGVAKNKVL